MASLNQYLNKDLTANDIAHSSSYASIAGGAGAGGLSMEQRKKILNQPRVVGAYHHSRLGSQGSSVKSRTADQNQSRVYDASNDSFGDEASGSNRQNGSIRDKKQIDSRSIERRQHFVEPQARKYDKYS